MRYLQAVLLAVFALPFVSAAQVPATTTPNEQLLAAVAACDAAAVKALLDRGASGDARTSRGVTALMLAASGSSTVLVPRSDPYFGGNERLPDRNRDDIPVMELLVSRGAAVNAQDEFGHTALWWAAALGNKLPNAQFLIDHRADVNMADRGGRTVVAAVQRRPGGARLDMTIALIKAGANLNVKDDTGTPLLTRVLSDEPIARAFLAGGADPNASDKTGATPLMSVARMRNVPLTQLLLDAGANVNAEDSSGATALTAAIHTSDGEVASLLLARGAVVTGRPGERAIEAAATLGNAALLRAMLAAGGDPNAVSSGGETLLMRTSQYRRVEPVDALLNAGARVRGTGRSGATALHSAAGEPRNGPVLELLIRRGADLNAQDVSGATALMRAAANGYADNVRVLLAAGADPRITTQAGVDALAMAIRNKDANLGPDRAGYTDRGAVIDLLRQATSGR